MEAFAQISKKNLGNQAKCSCQLSTWDCKNEAAAAVETPGRWRCKKSETSAKETCRQGVEPAQDRDYIDYNQQNPRVGPYLLYVSWIPNMLVNFAGHSTQHS